MLILFRSWFQGWVDGFKVGWWRMRVRAADRAFIYVRQGVYYDRELARRISINKFGEIYEYGDEVVYVFDDAMAKSARGRDVYEIFDDERILFVVDGEVVCAPVKGTGVAMDAMALSNFNRGDMARQVSESFKSSGKGFDMGKAKWLIALLVIALVLYVVYKVVLHGQIPGITTGNSTMPTPSPTLTPIYSALEWLVWGVSNV